MILAGTTTASVTSKELPISFAEMLLLCLRYVAYILRSKTAWNMHARTNHHHHAWKHVNTSHHHHAWIIIIIVKVKKFVIFVAGVGRFLQKCHLHSVSEGTGAITAQRRQSPSEDTGFTFLGCKVTGVKTALLGRPWGPYSRVVFAFSYMSGAILPEGWDDWGDSSKQRFIFYVHNYTYICTTI